MKREWAPFLASWDPRVMKGLRMEGSGISKVWAGTWSGASRPRGPSRPGQFPQAGVPAQQNAPQASYDAVWRGSRFWPDNQQQLEEKKKERETPRN